MATFKQLFDKELDALQLFEEKACSEEKNAELKALIDAGKELPVGYRRSVENNSIFIETGEKSNLTQEQIMNLVVLQQAKNIKTIKSCIAFLTALVAISLVVSVVVGIILPFTL